MAAPDLISQPYLVAMLADMGLSANKLAQLPPLATAASRAVRMFCNRYFTRATLDECYTATPRGPLVLRQHPVNALLRLCTNPTSVLTIVNTDRTTNQRATVRLATTGDVDLGLVVTGITLTRYASGVAYSLSVPFSLSVTVQAVADAVNALGGGWRATVQGSYGLWASADLKAVQGVLPAMGTQVQGLVIHVDDVAATLREASGILDLSGGSDDPFNSSRWGAFLSTDWGDPQVNGATNGVRVVYDAGFDVIPEDVQQAVVETVQAMLSRLDTDPSLASETVGQYSWQAGDNVPAIPDSAKQKLIPWRNVRG